MERAGDPWQSWDAGRVWAALACWDCCLAEGHVPLACNPAEIPEARGASNQLSDARLAAAVIRQDVQRAIDDLLATDRQSTRPRSGEIRGLIAGIRRLGPPTNGTLIHPHDEYISRVARNPRPREIGWIEYEAVHWGDVAQRLRIEDWETAKRRARIVCIALAYRLGARGQYHWPE